MFGNYLEKFQALWNLLMLKDFIQLLGTELCIFFILVCQLFVLFYTCAVTFVIIRWLTCKIYFVSSIHLCQNQIDRMPCMTESWPVKPIKFNVIIYYLLGFGAP